jgi:NitT/TauT family transport system substrate-binding protein
VWDHVVGYIADPKTQPDALKIMSARVGLSPEQYKPLLDGTHLIGVTEAKGVFRKTTGLDSLYGSSNNADDFNVKNAVYKSPQNLDGYIYPALTMAQP